MQQEDCEEAEVVEGMGSRESRGVEVNETKEDEDGDQSG